MKIESMSLRAQELRLGNWVYSPHSKMEWQVYPDDFRAIWDNPENYEGIPLTEEWLIKFGFDVQKPEDDCESYVLNGIGFIPYAQESKEMIGSVPKACFLLCGTYDCAIHYVHQLQNLYFSLTGEELTIKE